MYARILLKLVFVTVSCIPLTALAQDYVIEEEVEEQPLRHNNTINRINGANKMNDNTIENSTVTQTTGNSVVVNHGTMVINQQTVTPPPVENIVVEEDIAIEDAITEEDVIAEESDVGRVESIVGTSSEAEGYDIDYAFGLRPSAYFCERCDDALYGAGLFFRVTPFNHFAFQIEVDFLKNRQTKIPASFNLQLLFLPKYSKFNIYASYGLGVIASFGGGVTNHWRENKDELKTARLTWSSYTVRDPKENNLYMPVGMGIRLSFSHIELSFEGKYTMTFISERNDVYRDKVRKVLHGALVSIGVNYRL